MEIATEEVQEYIRKKGGLEHGLRDGWDSKGLVTGLGGHREGPLSAETQLVSLVQAGSGWPSPSGDMRFLPGKVRGFFVSNIFFKNFRPMVDYPPPGFPILVLMCENKRAKTSTCLSSPGEKVVHIYHLLMVRPNEGRVTVPILQMKKLKALRCKCICSVSVLYRPRLRSPDSHRYIFPKGTVLSVISLTTL